MSLASMVSNQTDWSDSFHTGFQSDNRNTTSASSFRKTSYACHMCHPGLTSCCCCSWYLISWQVSSVLAGFPASCLWMNFLSWLPQCSCSSMVRMLPSHSVSKLLFFAFVLLCFNRRLDLLIYRVWACKCAVKFIIIFIAHFDHLYLS